MPRGRTQRRAGRSAGQFSRWGPSDRHRPRGGGRNFRQSPGGILPLHGASRRAHLGGYPHGDALERDLWPVLPVGAGTAARSAANSAVLIEQGVRHSRRYGAPSSALVSRSRACRPEVGVPRAVPAIQRRSAIRRRSSEIGGAQRRRCGFRASRAMPVGDPLQAVRHGRRGRPRKRLMAANSVRCPRDRGESVKGGTAPLSPSEREARRRATHLGGYPHGHHDAPARERRPPVGTAPRSGASGAVLIEQGARHSRRYGAPSSAGFALPRDAGRRPALQACTPPGVGGAWPTAQKTDGSELRSLPAFSGECVKGGILPFHKKVTTHRNLPPRAEGAQGSFDARRVAPGGSEGGFTFKQTNNEHLRESTPPFRNARPRVRRTRVNS